MLRGITQLYIVVAILLITISAATALLFKNVKDENITMSANRILNLDSKPTPVPSPFEFITYTKPNIQKKQEYSIVMIGDSMTRDLGPRGGTFSTYINDLYKPHNVGIIIDNYAVGATNILQVNDQLEIETTYWDSTFPPLMSRHYDLILIESFGYNPLSMFDIQEGLKKQTEALKGLMEKLIINKPNSAILFVATIAPSKENYAKKVLFDISTQDRILQAEERMSYIRNHIDYAHTHNLPLVNIYEKSLDSAGSGELKYINPDDFIHPSSEGINFIGHQIAQYIYDNKILPY